MFRCRTCYDEKASSGLFQDRDRTEVYRPWRQASGVGRLCRRSAPRTKNHRPASPRLGQSQLGFQNRDDVCEIRGIPDSNRVDSVSPNEWRSLHRIVRAFSCDVPTKDLNLFRIKRGELHPICSFEESSPVHVHDNPFHGLRINALFSRRFVFSAHDSMTSLTRRIF